MKTQDLPLQNARGLARQAQISAPEGDVFASALFIHELPAQAADHIVAALTRRGVAVASLAAQQATAESPLGGDDLIALRDALASQIEGGPQLLIGHGLPGTLLLVRAEDMPSARAMALIHAPSSLSAWRSAKLHAHEHAISVQIADRPPLYVTSGLVDALSEAAVKAGAGAFHGAVLLAYAPLNPILAPEHATALFTTVRHSRSFIALDHSGHDLEHARDREHLVNVLTGWMEHYIPTKPRVELELGEAQVVVQTGRAHYHTDINAKGHALVADEPVELGGTDHGPGPYEFLQAALGACTAITVRMYADRKELPLESIRVALTHQKITGEAGERVDLFTRKIALAGPLTQEQRDKLKEIADKCPVHKTLTHGKIEVQTALADAE